MVTCRTKIDNVRLGRPRCAADRDAAQNCPHAIDRLCSAPLHPVTRPKRRRCA
jgi:hypothetical protein